MSEPEQPASDAEGLTPPDDDVPSSKDLSLSAGGAGRALSGTEVEDILRRASDADGSPHLPVTDGPTVADLMEAALEVGLDPANVRRASAVTPADLGGASRQITGAPTRTAMRADLPGAPPSDWSFVADAAQRVTGRPGEVVQTGPDGVVWRENHGLGRTRVSADARGLYVEVDRGGYYLAHWFAGLLGWAALSSVLPVTLGPVLASVLFLVTPVLMARPFWKRSHAKTRRQLEELTMELLRAAEEHVD
jgi:hypothetical protein